MNKPCVLSIEDIKRIWESWPASKKAAPTFEEWLCQAQRDADVKFYEQLEMQYLDDCREVNEMQIRQEVAREIFEWGNEDCPHLGKVKGVALAHRHDCYECWQSLKSKYGGKK